jgi:hypothetical protein
VTSKYITEFPTASPLVRTDALAVDNGTTTKCTTVAGVLGLMLAADVPALASTKIGDFATAVDARLTGYQATSAKDTANGYAGLDSSGKLSTSALPALALTETSVVASQVAMLALTAQPGDLAVRTDLNKTFILVTSPASTLGNWQELLTPTDTVTSVAGKSGAVTLAAADITSGVFGVARGGTGLATIASGKLLYASALDTLAALSLGSGLAITSGVLDTVGGGGGASLSVANTWTATQTFAAGTSGADGTGTNGAATDYTISAGRSTGTAAAGRIVWQAASKGGSSGTSQQTLREIMSLECDTAVSNDFFVLKPNVTVGSASLGTAAAPFYKTVTTNVSARYLRLGDLGGAPQINIDGQDGVAKIGAAVELAWTATDATGTSDATIGRLAAGVAKIGNGSSGYGALAVTNLRATTTASATTPGSVVKKWEIFDAAGASLGFIPIYSAIT